MHERVAARFSKSRKKSCNEQNDTTIDTNNAFCANLFTTFYKYGKSACITWLPSVEKPFTFGLPLQGTGRKCNVLSAHITPTLTPHLTIEEHTSTPRETSRAPNSRILHPPHELLESYCTSKVIARWKAAPSPTNTPTKKKNFNSSVRILSPPPRHPREGRQHTIQGDCALMRTAFT